MGGLVLQAVVPHCPYHLARASATLSHTLLAGLSRQPSPACQVSQVQQIGCHNSQEYRKHLRV
jgi:hypothetical protein